MALSIDELTSPITEDQALEKMLDIAETLGLRARSWRKGGSLRVILRVAARMYAAMSAIVAAFIAAGFLETSTGEWLTRLARHVYGVERRAATFAREQLTLTNNGGGLFEDIGPGEIVAINPTTKKAYRNTTLFTLNPLQTLELEFEAVEEGAASSAPPGTIVDLETHLDQVEVTNPRAFIAMDAEQDPELRQACRDKLAALSVRGPRGAYRWAVREAKRADGNAVNINRTLVSTSSSTGRVTVTVAAPSGAPAPEDLAAVVESIEQLARPDAVRVTTQAATEVLITRALTVYARRTDGVSAADIRTLVEAAIVREAPNYPIGGYPKPPATTGKVWADWIKAIAKGAHETIYEVDGEGGDVELTTGQVAVFEVTAPEVRLAEVAVTS